MIALVDCDPICYRIAFACANETVKQAMRSIDSYVSSLLISADREDAFYDSFKFYLSDSTANNFRTPLAVTAPYKGNRTAEKPAHLEALRQFMIREWKAVVSDGQEADDAVAIDSTNNPDALIISVDKDLDQLPGWHFNYVKNKHYYISNDEGLLNFYTQILTGDNIDNIIGIKGVGIIRARKILDGCSSEQEMFDACVDAYEGNIDRVLENGVLLWLRRFPGQIWKGVNVDP